MNAMIAPSPAPSCPPSYEPRSEEFVLRRTGKRPLRFRGERIGFGTTKRHTTMDWSNVTIYKTVAGCYIAVVEHCHGYPGMCEISDTLTAGCANELLASARHLDTAAYGACAAALRQALIDDGVEEVA